MSAKKLPKLDDEFFKLFGVEEGGEEKFREEVQANMERELKNAVRTKIKKQSNESIVRFEFSGIASSIGLQ